jgi:hypothetical protein
MDYVNVKIHIIWIKQIYNVKIVTRHVYSVMDPSLITVCNVGIMV